MFRHLQNNLNKYKKVMTSSDAIERVKCLEAGVFKQNPFKNTEANIERKEDEVELVEQSFEDINFE